MDRRPPRIMPPTPNAPADPAAPVPGRRARRWRAPGPPRRRWRALPAYVLAALAIGLGAFVWAFPGVARPMPPTPAPAAVTVEVTPTADPRTVPCPAEDACTIDYRDGAWHIGEPGSAAEEAD